MTDSRNFFPGTSTADQPRLEFVFEIRLHFERVQNIQNMPSGAGRGGAYVDSGEVTGPWLNGTVVPASGGDYALFRPDEVLGIDARYMLEADDGTLILMYNRGYIWGREADTMQRFSAWVHKQGPPVDLSEYYFRTCPSFEVEQGKHDWLMRHVIIGIGERRDDGNLIRYFALL